VSLPEDIYTLLSDTDPLTDLVDTRISPYVRNASEQTFPACVFEVSNTTIESDSGGSVAHCFSDVTVTALGRTFIEADEVAETILAAMTSWSDTNACVAMTTPTAVTRDQEMPYDGSQDLVYRTSIDFSIDHGVAI